VPISGRALYDGAIHLTGSIEGACLSSSTGVKFSVVCGADSRPTGFRPPPSRERSHAKRPVSIPASNCADGRGCQSVNFVGLALQGRSVDAAIAYDAAGADELCFLIFACNPRNQRHKCVDLVTRTANTATFPLTLAWWSALSRDVALRCLLAGADKVKL